MVGEASNGREAVDLVRRLAPHVVLMDITMPEMNGIEATQQIVTACPGTRVVALSMHSDRQFVTAILRAGAVGYLLKNSAASELSAALDAAMAGKSYLSPDAANAVMDNLLGRAPAETESAFATLTARQREVLQLIAEGRTSKEIAARLDIGVKTVETYRAQLMEKLGLRTVAELTKYAVRHGLTSLD